MEKHTEKNANRGLAWLCIFIGLYISATSTGLLPLNKADLHVPTWVFFIVGAVVFIAGVMILVRHHSKVNSILAAILLVMMGSIGVWVAFYGPAENISGGLPFIPHEYNIMLARAVFGGGALITFLMSAYIIRKLFTNNA